MKKLVCVILLFHIISNLNAQGVGINETGDTPHESAILDVSSTSKGFLPPRMNTAQRDAIINPAIGLFIFNTDNSCMELFTNIGWFSSCNTTQNASYAIPSGTILPFAGDISNIPNGFLLCDGSELDTNTYHELFQAVGYAWGGSNSAFFLPDLRGQFLRGADLGSGNDPDAASRNAAQLGGNTGVNVGSIQADQFQEHNHGGGNHSHSFSHLWISNNTGNPDGALDSHTGGTQNRRYWRGNVTGNFTTNTSGEIIQNQGGAETRPKNAAVNYVICYSSSLVDFLTEESDPAFFASVAAGITESDTANWNSKQNELSAGLGISIINDTVSLNLAEFDFLMPAGTILSFAGDTSKVPNGFLLCDGSSLDTADYNPLFQVIGYNWGGSGQNFNLPDLRGQFLRGTDLNSGNDPGVSNRIGGNANDKVGSSQSDAFAEHNHGGGNHSHNFSHLWISNNTGNPDGALDSHTGSTQNRRYWRGNVTGNFTTNTSGEIIQNQGDLETRPKNVAVNYMICYTNSISQVNNLGGGNLPSGGNLSIFNNDVGFISSENDPIFNASIAAGINTTDTAYWNNKQDVLVAGNGINISNNTIATSGLNQEYYEVFDNSAVIVGNASWTDFPGMTITVNTTDSAHYELNSTLAGRLSNDTYFFSRLVIDGIPHPFLRSAASGIWVAPSISGRIPLSPGTHEIKIQFRSGGPIEFGGTLDYTTRFMYLKRL
jgi:microcystin-dependent protein